MSYYPIKLDKIRNLKYGMRAIDLIEKKFGKPIMKIEGIGDGALTMEEYATLIWAGLVHEDKELTPDKVMDLIDEYSSITKVTQDMWKALNEVFVKEEDKEDEGKNK
jgi:hypothetical protein